MYKFKIFRSRNNQFYFTFVASNGQILMTSETYTSKQSCEYAIGVMKAEVSKAAISDES